MNTEPKLSFITLLLMVSFASVNAVLFTPALPDIAKYFVISSETAQQTITWFLIGYTIGQLLYGPLANRFGRKQALFVGIGLQIISSLICILAGLIHVFSILVIGRFFLALGSGVGLTMTFTLVNEFYKPAAASQKISYVMLAFAITPGLGAAIGGVLNTHLGWMSCFFAGALYGAILFIQVAKLPELQTTLNYDALKIKNLIKDYSAQFKNTKVIAGGLLMGASTCFFYVFAAIAPFIAISFLGMNSLGYGLANILPPIGLIFGSLSSAYLTKHYPFKSIIHIGILIASAGTFLMLFTILTSLSALYSLFLPLIIIYFGLSLVLANASTIAMTYTSNKAHGSSVMNFINIGIATLGVLALGFFTVTKLLLPFVFLLLCIAMVFVYRAFIGVISADKVE